MGIDRDAHYSQILFAWSLEPLLCKIRLNPDIVGLSVGGMQYKISFNADDMLYSLTNPTNLPNLLQEIETYGTLSKLQNQFFEIRSDGGCDS